VKLVFPDTETTGLDRSSDEIIELAALRVDWPSWRVDGVYYRRFAVTPPLSCPADEIARSWSRARSRGWCGARWRSCSGDTYAGGRKTNGPEVETAEPFPGAYPRAKAL
jgi:hypothetical protein